MNSKSQFLAQQELSKWWSGVVADPRFDRVLLHVSAMAFDSSMTDEQRKGAFLFREELQNLSTPEHVEPRISGPRLDHDFDIKPKTVETPKPKTK